jgi:rhodanese-related sulfurtransferase
MDQYIEFASNHIFLVSAFFIVTSLLAWNLINNPGGKFNVGPSDATRLINQEGALILDVRSMAEFKGGHIINAENAPLNSLKNHLKKLEKHKQQTLIAVCQSGSRSASACTTLRKAGFEHVYNLQGGMMAWENANLPVKRGK